MLRVPSSWLGRPVPQRPVRAAGGLAVAAPPGRSRPPRRSHNSTSGRRFARPATQGRLVEMITHRLALIAGVASALTLLPAVASAAAVHGSYTTIDVPGAAGTVAGYVNDQG